MRNPDRLEVLERANELTDRTYAATATLPDSERFNLVPQMRRAASAIGANIAEGCGRSTELSFLSYLQNAMASASEVEQHASQCLRLAMGDDALLTEVLALSRRVKMMLTKLQQAIRLRSAAQRRRKGPRSGPPG